MSKKATLWTTLLLICLSLVGFGYQAWNKTGRSTDFRQDNPVLIDARDAKPETNYYLHVNHQWLKETEIPDDRMVVSIDGQISDEIEERLKNDLQDLLSGKEKTDVEGMDTLLAYYKLMTDFKERDRLGASPVKPIVTTLEGISDLEDLAGKSKDLFLSALYHPIILYPGQDQADSSKQVMTLSAPPLFFDDTSFYQDSESLAYYQDQYATYTIDLLKLIGYDQASAEKLAWEALAFDALIADYVPSAEELSNDDATYHIRSAEQVRAYSDLFQLDQVANQLVGQEVTAFNVRTPDYFDNLSFILSEPHFDMIKSWMIVSELMSDAPLLSDKLRIAADAFLDNSYGLDPISKEEAAFELITKHFGEPLSRYYGKKYFTDKAKKQVIKMIEQIKDTYKKRLQDNDWLSESTKAAAINKLDKMRYYVGYDDTVSEDIAKIKIDLKAGFFDNYYRLVKEQTAASFADFSAPYDKDGFVANSFDVNAYYDPQSNSMHFPTGYLQAPFFSEEQSLAKNYGALGAVIGHEITHAFDSNGANYDENGNLANWWTDSDKAIFLAKADKLVDFWDGLNYEGEYVNGYLTLTENIADSSGLSVSLEALKAIDPDADLKEFFESYAMTYRFKALSGYTLSLMAIDVHAPAELRVNVSLQHLDAFYETYKIKPGDAMYLPKEERIKIW